MFGFWNRQVTRTKSVLRSWMLTSVPTYICSMQGMSGNRGTKLALEKRITCRTTTALRFWLLTSVLSLIDPYIFSWQACLRDIRGWTKYFIILSVSAGSADPCAIQHHEGDDDVRSNLRFEDRKSRGIIGYLRSNNRNIYLRALSDLKLDALEIPRLSEMLFKCACNSDVFAYRVAITGDRCSVSCALRGFSASRFRLIRKNQGSIF